MVRTVYSPEYCKEYLEKCAEKEPLIVGLILGQVTNARENVTYLARTPQEKAGDNVTEAFKSKGNFNLFNIPDISEEWVADHAKHVTRMLPGGMFVQGIFIIIEDDIFGKPENFTKVCSTIKHLYSVLTSTNYMYGFCPTQKDLLILHMGRESKVIICKSIEVGTGNRVPALKPVDWKFLSKPQLWQRLDCYYEFDEIYPIIVKNGGISVKQQFLKVLETAHKAVDSSVMFIDGNIRLGLETLQEFNMLIKSKSSMKSPQADALKTMQVSLFVPFENTLPETVEYLECDGNVHFSGVVSSSVFLYPGATVTEAIAAVKQDIIRSLASRFTMHCDALIDDNLLPEEKVCFNEPPRRVLVPVGSLYFCDYLFPGEAPAEALVSVKELLDLQLNEEDVICDVETPADTSEFDALDRDVSSEEMLTTPKEASQFMYITGICFAMFVLIVSIIVHYYDSLYIFVRKLFK